MDAGEKTVKRTPEWAGLLVGFAFVPAVPCVPLAFVWVLNTLFGMSLAYTFRTWLAAFAVCVFLGLLVYRKG